MKVKDFILKLKRLNPEYEIKFLFNNDEWCSGELKKIKKDDDDQSYQFFIDN